MESFVRNLASNPKSHDELVKKLRLQAILLDPAHKHPKPPRPNRAHKLSSREKRKLELHKIPPEQQCYQDFLPLHRLWVGYMEELLQLGGGGGGGAKK